MKQTLVFLYSLAVIAAALPCQSMADTSKNQQIAITSAQQQQPVAAPNNTAWWPICPTSTVTACGHNIVVPGTAAGTSVELVLPSPFVHQHFWAHCVANNYPITATSTAALMVDQPSCILQTCQNDTVTICQHAINVAGGVSVGATEEVAVPTDMLADSSNHPSFSVQCVEDAQDKTSYQIADDSSVSCNAFPCPMAELQVCDTLITIKDRNPIGTVLNLKMPPPYNPDAFSVECLGSGGNSPTYQLLDISGVSCVKSAP